VLSMTTRHKSLLAVVSERAWKLLASFGFGILVIAIPCNVVIGSCNQNVLTWSQVVDIISKPSWSLLDPAHLSFLPYLFILSTIHLPLFAVIYEAYEKHTNSSLQVTATSPLAAFTSANDNNQHQQDSSSSSSSSSSNNNIIIINDNDNDNGSDSSNDDNDKSTSNRNATHRVPSWFRIMSLVYLAILTAILNTSWAQFWLWITLFGISSNIFNTLWPLEAWSRLTHNVYHQSIRQRSFSASVYVLAFGMTPVFCWASEWWLHDFEFSTTGILLLYLAVPMLVYTPTHVRPYRRLAPWFWINTPFLGLALVVVACTLITGIPEHIPIFQGYEQRVSGFLGMWLSKRRLFAILFMYFCHSTFFVAGFTWTLQAAHFPSLPENNALFGVFGCVMIVLWLNSLSGNISSDFMFVTAGFVSYHDRRKRIFYHLGGWLYCFICVTYLKRYAEHPFDNTSWDRRVMRVLDDMTFGVILCHPLWTYIGACAINNVWFLQEIAYESKVVLLTAFAYVMSALWVLVFARIPFARRMLGIRYL
jgi:hypothetical protein